MGNNGCIMMTGNSTPFEVSESVDATCLWNTYCLDLGCGGVGLAVCFFLPI